MDTATPEATAGRAGWRPTGSLPEPLPFVRRVVRALLLSSPAYRELSPSDRQRLAQAMVRVGFTAASLVREEVDSDLEARSATATMGPGDGPTRGVRGAVAGPGALAMAQAAGDSFSGVAAERVAGTTRAILNAVSFPRFVTDLINGVFKAMIDSSIQQMHAYVELLNNVAASTEGFADANLGPDRARSWLVEKYPGSFELQTEDDGEGDGDDGRPAAPRSTLRLKDGVSPPSPESLKTDLGLGDQESVPTGDPETTLVPLARRRLAKMRQEMLATMVMLGMQRIVIDSGRINASMRFHIDTRSAAQDDRGSTLDIQNRINAAGSYGFGLWGVSASIQNTIGYVSTQRTQTTEEMNTDLDLSSSVEINFRSDYLPLNRLAGADQVSRIRQNSRNPEAEEAKAAADVRKARESQAARSETERRASLDRILTPKSTPAPSPGSPGTEEAADRARQRAASGGTSKKGEAAKPAESSKKGEAAKPAESSKKEAAKPAGSSKEEAKKPGGTTSAPSRDEAP
jgi:hypothetical protein